jgi:hypothetical protein
MSPWVRRCLTLASILVVWLVARPAAASAPLCDDRGASALAPLPVLDAPNASLNVGERGDGCDEAGARDHAYHRGERAPRITPFVHADFAPVSVVHDVQPAGRESTSVVASEGALLPGVRRSVDRPPRRA